MILHHNLFFMSAPFIGLLLFTLVFIIGYYLFVANILRRKLASQPFKNKGRHWVPMQQTALHQLPHQLIDRPGIEETISIEKDTMALEQPLEILDDEESVLLKAAEIVVEKVQDVINHIASQPPNPEEVFSKIKAIVNQYQLFRDTEYFDAINSFIAITVERDCAIQMTKEQLLDLWQ